MGVTGLSSYLKNEMGFDSSYVDDQGVNIQLRILNLQNNQTIQQIDDHYKPNDKNSNNNNSNINNSNDTQQPIQKKEFNLFQINQILKEDKLDIKIEQQEIINSTNKSDKKKTYYQFKKELVEKKHQDQVDELNRKKLEIQQQQQQQQQQSTTVGEPISVDHVFIDMNGIIHKQVRRNLDSTITLDRIKTDVVISLKHYLKSTSALIKKVKSIQFIFDGPGTRSKILLQRKRRLKSITDNDLSINSSMITPGTSFMGEMKELLIDFSKKLLKEGRYYNLKDIHVSGSDRWGEGEFKIFEHIHHSNWNENVNVAIFTCDSDTILYALLSDANIKLFDLYNPKQYKDISLLKSKLASLVPHKDKKQVIVDFVFLNLFRGNDLLPSLQLFNFDSVWNAYINDKSKDGIYNLEKSEINWDLLLKLFDENEIINYQPTKISIRGEFRSMLVVLAKYIGRTSDKIPFKYDTLPTDDPNIVDIVISVDGKNYTERVPLSTPNAHQQFLRKFFDLSHEFWDNYKALLTSDQISSLKRRLETSIANHETANAEEPSIEEYFEGIIWQMNLMHGKCSNFQFYYPYFFGPTIDSINNPVPIQHRPRADPLRPLQFCLALTHSQSKSNVNEIFHPIFDELPHFSISQHISSDAWKHRDAINQLDQLFNKYIDKSKLNEFEQSQLSFKPTINLSKSKNGLFMREELIENNENNTSRYSSPKFLETLPNRQPNYNTSESRNTTFKSNTRYNNNISHENKNKYNNNNNNNNNNETRNYAYKKYNNNNNNNNNIYLNNINTSKLSSPNLSTSDTANRSFSTLSLSRCTYSTGAAAVFRSNLVQPKHFTSRFIYPLRSILSLSKKL